MKLTARGRGVIARVQRTVALEANEFRSEGRKLRTELVLLSDGVIGIKRTWLKPDGKVDHTDGWKVHARLKPERYKEMKRDPATYAVAWVERKQAKGFA